MGKFFLGLITLCVISFGIWYYYFSDQTIFSKGTIDFSPLEFAKGGLIPQKFTCDGRDISPSFSIARVPLDAKSLVIVMEDTDAPSLFTHFIMFNIDPAIETVDQGTVPGGALVGTNDFGKIDYNGPCPPLGTHKYVYRIYALNKYLNLTEKATRADIDKEIRGSIISKGEFSGEYTKN